MIQLKLERTGEDFTTGIVNVPLNTPAFIFLIVRDMKEIKDAQRVFEDKSITYTIEQRRHKAILKSSELVDRKIIDSIKLNERFEPKAQNYYRYVFFELDTLMEDIVDCVIQVFKDYRLPLYYHRTMRGWHFFCVKPVNEELYHEIMNRLKPFNMDCPHVTMRIRPNKWIGEPEIFRIHNVEMSALHSDTLKFADMITDQTYWKFATKIGAGKWIVDRKYLLVNYKQTGELANR